MSIIAVVGQTYTFAVSVISQADTNIFQTNPTIAAGDFQRSINGGAFGNMDNIPTVTPGAGRRIEFVLSAAETTAAADNGTIYIVGTDAAGAEWQDIAIEVRVRSADLAIDGDEMGLVNDAITSAKYDEATAYPIVDPDVGNTYIARTGADGDTLEDISDQIDGLTLAIAKGAIEFTYTLTNSVSGLPIDAADIWVTTDLAGANVIWRGVTDSFGVARDAANELPWLDAGTVFFFRQKIGFTFTNPDTEVVS